MTMPHVTILLAVLVSATPAMAKERVDPAGYPELSQEALLPVVLDRLKHELSDPRSIRDLVMCPASSIRLVDGKPDGWVVRLEFNTKNAAGGYIGIKSYNVLFRHRLISGPVALGSFANNAGFDGIINRMIDRQFATCPAVPDKIVQAILDGPQ